MSLPFIDSSVTDLMKKAGYNGVADLPLDKRIDAQEQLLTFYQEKLDKAPRPFITDRTPLDMIAYCLGELTMHNSTPEIGMRYASYTARCFAVTAQLFSQIILVRPLPVFEVDATKPPPNLGYQWLIQLLIEGSAAKLDGRVAYSTLLTDKHEDRVRLAAETFERYHNAIREFKAMHIFH